MADPQLTYPTVSGSGEVYVKETRDISKLLPGDWQRSASAPVRDAIIQGLFGVMQELQAAIGYAAAQADPLRATVQYLTGLADDRGFAPAPGEDEEAFRLRLTDTPDLVSYQAIVDRVSEIVLPHSTILPRVFDSVLDGLFITDGTGEYRSYIGSPPDYPDRLYPHHAAVNDGYSLPQSHPTGAWVFDDTIGRYFVVVVPDLSPQDSTPSYLYSGKNLSDAFFVGDGTSTDNISFVLADFQSALTVYQTIINAVERMIGQGIRWQLYADPDLT